MVLNHRLVLIIGLFVDLDAKMSDSLFVDLLKKLASGVNDILSDWILFVFARRNVPCLKFMIECSFDIINYERKIDVSINIQHIHQESFKNIVHSLPFFSNFINIHENRI